MNTTQTLRLIPPATAGSRRNLWRTYYLEARSEFVKVLRMPAFAIPTLSFPIVFYVFFGIVFGGNMTNGENLATYLLATYGAFGVIGAALFGFGVGIAVERGQGWMLLKRASPMPLGAYFAARIVVAMLFGSVIVGSLFLIGILAGGVELAGSTLAALAAVLIVGALPFCAFGLALGYLAGPNSAAPLVNLIYLPMGFLCGLWIPIVILPGFVQKLAHFLPAYHYAQIALKTIGADAGESPWIHLGYLAGFTLVCLGAARIGYRRDEDRTYG